MNNQIEEILDEFNFFKVKCVMDALDWAWATKGGFQVPSIRQLEEHARVLLEDVSDKTDYHISCGGFVARNRNGRLSLGFVVEEWPLEFVDEREEP